MIFDRQTDLTQIWLFFTAKNSLKYNKSNYFDVAQQKKLKK